MEEDDEILDINIDPFAEQWVQPFEEQEENKAAEGQSKEQMRDYVGMKLRKKLTTVCKRIALTSLFCIRIINYLVFLVWSEVSHYFKIIGVVV